FARAMTFLDASEAERDREMHEKEARRRRKLRQARVLMAVFAAAFLLMLGLGAYALQARLHAEGAQRLAEGEAVRANAALGGVRQEQARVEKEKRRAEQ